MDPRDTEGGSKETDELPRSHRELQSLNSLDTW